MRQQRASASRGRVELEAERQAAAVIAAGRLMPGMPATLPGSCCG
jgi:hypothetical protein